MARLRRWTLQLWPRSRGFQCVLSAADMRGTIEAQNISRLNALHEKRQTHSIALCEEVGFAMDVCRNVVRSLRLKDWEEIADGW